MHVFRLGHFARSKIKSESIVLIKYYIITILKKIGAFRPIFNKVNKWISHCIFKSCLEGFGFSFQARKLIFCQMACIYLINSSGGPQSLDFLITYSYPLPKTFVVRPQRLNPGLAIVTLYAM